MTERITPVETQPVPTDQGMQFLQQVYPGEPTERLQSLEPDSLNNLCHTLINTYYGKCYWRTRGKWRELVKIKASTAKQYVDGISLDDLDAPSEWTSDLRMFHIYDVATWLRKKLLPSDGDIGQILEDEEKRPKKIGINNWVNAREEYFQTLYGDSETSLSLLTTNARDTMKPFAHTNEWKGNKQTIAQSILEIALLHDEASRADEESIYSFVNPNEDLERVAEFTAHVIWAWGVGWQPHSYESDAATQFPFIQLCNESYYPDLGDRTTQLAIEAIAAVGETLQALGVKSHFKSDTGKRSGAYAALIASRHSPEQVKSWMNGSTLQAYYENEGLNTEQLAKVDRILLARSLRAEKPIEYVMNALEAWSGDLSDEGIQKITGLSIDQIQKIFTPTLRKYLIGNYTNHSAKVLKIVEAFSAQLSDEALAKHFGWSQNAIRTSISTTDRIRAALTRDPLAKIKIKIDAIENPRFKDKAELALNLGISARETKKIFTPSELLEISIRHGDEAGMELKRIVKNYQEVLSTANLARVLEINEENVDALFPHYIRRKLATYQNPVSKARTVKSVASRLAAEGLPRSVCNHAALTVSTKKLNPVVEKVKLEMDSCPKNLPRDLWGCVAYFQFNKTREERLQVAYSVMDQYRKRPTSAEATSALAKSHTIPAFGGSDNTIGQNPEDIYIAQEQENNLPRTLTDLAGQSGVSMDEISQLLDAFKSGDQLDGHLLPLLEKLRETAHEE